MSEDPLIAGPHPNPLPAIPGEGIKPIPAALAVRLARRGVWSARLARFGLICVGLAGFLLAQDKTLPAGMGLLFAAAMGWVALVARTARNQQDLIRVPAWIDAGDFKRAEIAVARALGRFSVAVRPRLQSLHSLAVSRHQQQQYADARELAAAALSYRQPKPVADNLRLMIAETSLRLNDLAGAHAALGEIKTPVPMRESMKLLELQTDYCVRIGAWPHIAHDLPTKVDMAEMLPAESAAAVQAMLALAMRNLNQPAWADWLSKRAALLVDPAELVRRHPPLAGVFALIPSLGIPGDGKTPFRPVNSTPDAGV